MSSSRSITLGDPTETSAKLCEWPPGELLARIRWTANCPSRIRAAAAQGDFGLYWAERSAALPARRRWPIAERQRSDSLVLLSAGSLFEPATTETVPAIGPPESPGSGAHLAPSRRQTFDFREPTAAAWRTTAKRLFDAARRISGGGRRAATARRLSALTREFEQQVAAGRMAPERPEARIDGLLRALWTLDIIIRFARNLPVDVAEHLWKTAFIESVLHSGKVAPTGCVAEGVTASFADVSGDRLNPVVGSAVAALERMLLGELQLTAGLVFTDVCGAGKLRRRGARAIASELLDLTDTDGTPSAELWPLVASWTASVYRAVLAGRLFDRPVLPSAGADRLQDLVVCLAGSMLRNGRLAMCCETGPWIGRLLARAAALARLPGRHPARRVLRVVSRAAGASPSGTLRRTSGGFGAPGGDAPSRASASTGTEPRPMVAYRRMAPPAAGTFPLVQSDWARFGRMRSDWSASGDVLSVAYSDGVTRLELAPRGRPVFRGEWSARLCVGGAAVELAEWECVCTHADEDCEYIELHAESPCGARWNRQILLSRGDRFALLAEAVVVPHPAPLEICATLPAAETTKLKSSEGGVAAVVRRGRGRRILVTAPETREPESPAVVGRPSPLEITADGRMFAYRVADPSGGIFWPVVISWSESDVRPQWRALTVAENRRRVPASWAGAFRLRLGKLHLLMYRSLRQPATARTFLGCHSEKETYVAHIRPRGKLEPILLVDA